MHKLVLATRNAKKSRELQAMLPPELRANLGVHTADEWPDMPEVDETGETFLDNALLKAKAVAHHTGYLSLGDDSGLEVDVLAGAPGVRSARYAGEPADDAANMRKLLDALSHFLDLGSRTARFRCTVVLYDPNQSSAIFTCSGVCEGSIALMPEGQGGFGYDPVFVPRGSDQTFATMTPEAKHALSHRGQAMRQTVQFLVQFLT